MAQFRHYQPHSGGFAWIKIQVRTFTAFTHDFFCLATRPILPFSELRDFIEMPYEDTGRNRSPICNGMMPALKAEYMGRGRDGHPCLLLDDLASSPTSGGVNCGRSSNWSPRSQPKQDEIY